MTQWFELIFIKFLAPSAWPLALVLLCYWFRAEISSFLRRGIKVGPTGFEAVPPAQDADRVDEETQQGLDQEPRDLPPNPILEPWQKPILDDVARLKANNVSTDWILNITIRDLSVARQRIAYETISRQIFGTQIDLLTRFKDGLRRSRASIDDIYLEHTRRVKAIGGIEPTFDLWIGFLIRLDLVERINGNYQITQYGRSYLEFVIRENIGLKPL